MSPKGRPIPGTALRNYGGDELERWYTPAPVVAGQVEHARRFVSELPSGALVFDPFAGQWPYRDELTRWAANAVSELSDIDPVTPADVQKRTWEAAVHELHPAPFSSRNVPVVCVTNPAFSCATKFAGAMLANAQTRRESLILSLLLPISFLEPVHDKRRPLDSRRTLFEHYAPTAIEFCGRIQFQGPGMDRVNARRLMRGLKPAKHAGMSYAYVLWIVEDGQPRERTAPTWRPWSQS